MRGIGRRREGQHVDVHLELLHQLLVLHAEALLLVDHEQAEVLEAHALRQQAVGADHAVDVPRRQSGHHVTGLRRREEAAEHLDADRVAGEAVAERGAVLRGEQGGRRQHGDLLAVLDRLEGGADRHLGLAEADVAAHQSVHRVRPLHVVLDGDDGRVLVGRLDVREGVLHLRLPRRIGPEGEALGVHPLLVQHHQLLGDLPDGRSDPALGLGEVGTAEAMQRRRLTTDVLTQRVDLVRRHVQPVVALVGDEQIVALDTPDRPAHHALVAPDTVLEVHHVHARLEVLDQRHAVATGAGTPVGTAPAGEIGLGDHRHTRGGHGDAVVQRRDHHVTAGAGEVDDRRVDHRQIEPVVEEHLVHSGRRAGGVGGDDDAVAVAQQRRQPSGEGGAVAGERAPPRRFHHRGRRGLGRRVDRPERAGVRQQAVGLGVQAGEPAVDGPTPGRRQRGRQVVLLGEQVGDAVTGAARLDQHDLGVGRQHVGQQRLLRRQPRQPALHAVEQLALGETLPLLATPGLGGDEATRPLAHGLVGQQLAGREDVHLVEVGDRSLVVDAERRQTVDVVAPQVDAHRHVAAGGVHVDDLAASGELAAMLHQLLAAVPELHQPAHQVVGIDDVAAAHRDRLDRGRAGAETLEHGAGTGHHHRRTPRRIAQPPQQLEAPAHGLHGR